MKRAACLDSVVDSVVRLAVLFVAAVALPQRLCADERETFFESRIRPVLAETCFRCHGDAKVSGGLRVDSRAALMRGGESGPAIVPGKARDSLLIHAIERRDDVSAMPPDKSRKLRADQIADFAKWIDEGALWPEKSVAFVAKPHWAFEPIRDVAPPGSSDSGASPAAVRGNRTSVDAFLFAPSPGESRLARDPPRFVVVGPDGPARADKLALLRRATFDLTGLPPTPDEVRDFLDDASPDAFDRVVDRLLRSPEYGERWARHWLDVVRYADTAGETADYPVPLAWQYRNYVVDAFNADKPYDQFLREQIAGDILAREGPLELYAERAIATGFLAISRRFGFDSENYHHLTIQDTIDTLGQAVLGLSLGCARCHDHKFDPVTMRDYYALYGIFDSSRYPFPGSEQKQKIRTLLPLQSPVATQGPWRDFESTVARRTRQLEQLGRPVPPALLRSLDDYDGDFELQAVAAGGSRGVLVPPWTYEGLIAVTNSAQSPFKNVYERGKVGAHVAGGAAYRLAQSLHPRRVAGREWHVNVDFRLPPPTDAASGRHRFWLGTRTARSPDTQSTSPPEWGDSPAIELWLGADALYARSGERWASLAPLAPNQWHNLQLSLDLVARTFSGRLSTPAGTTTPAGSTTIATRPFVSTWSEAIDFVAWDVEPGGAASDGKDGASVAPALDLDNFSIREAPHRAASLEPPSPADSSDADLAAIHARLAQLVGADAEFEFQRDGEPPAKPWNPGPNSLVKLARRAQSPFRNLFPPGELGIHMPNRGPYDGFGLTPPTSWKAASTERLYAAFDFRCAEQTQGGDGSWRYYLGHGPGSSAAVELFFHGREFFRRSAGATDAVCKLDADRWYQVQLTLELSTRRYSGVIASEASRHEFSGRISPEWDGTLDYSFIDSYGHLGGVRPALDVDNYVIRETPFAALDGAPRRDDDSVRTRLTEASELRRRAADMARSADTLRQELDELLVRGPVPLAYAMSEGTPHDVRMHLRGEPDRLGEVVPRGVPRVVGGRTLALDSTASGRRELATWLTDPRNPLVARVMVNRVWQYHFGEGLVATPNDFGLRGAPPANRDLLDHLATRFVRDGWSIKSLHRLIMSSAAYQQPAGANRAAVRRRRLSAEEIRDSILAVTGELERSPGKGHPFPPAVNWGFTQHNPFIAVYEHDRRSIYLMTQRLKRHPFLALFDGPDPNASTAIRLGTTVPTQALYFLNDSFVHAKTDRWAARLLHDATKSAGASEPNAQRSGQSEWLDAAFRQALGRPPAASERDDARSFLSDYRAELQTLGLDNPEARAVAAYLRTLIASNEFLHVE